MEMIFLIMNNSMKRRQTSETFLLSAILSLSGGFQDAYTYTLRGKVFANAQTGNVVLMSEHLMRSEWMIAFKYLLPLVAFALGIIFAEQIEHKFKKSKILHWRQLVLIFEIIILFTVSIIPKNLNTLANVLVSLSCSMQVQTFRKMNGLGYASTMCIGNLRGGTESLSIFLREKNKNMLKKALNYYGIIFIFAIGAGLGGIISDIIGISAILLSCVLLLIAFGMMYNEKA